MEQSGSYKLPLTAPAGSAVGGVLKAVNPEGVDVIITRLVLDISTGVGTAVTVDAGVDDGGDVSSDNLLDGASVQAAGVLDNVGDGGTNGLPAVLWPAGEYLVITASGAGAALEGFAHVQYIRR